MSSYAFLNAPLPADGSCFPIVLTSHRGDALRVQTDERAEDLASHGYVVVAILAFLNQHLRAELATFPLAGYPRAVNVRVK